MGEDEGEGEKESFLTLTLSRHAFGRSLWRPREREKIKKIKKRCCNLSIILTEFENFYKI
jgi:hypothetical protein